MRKLFLLLAFAGAVLAYHGYEEYQLGSAASSEPVAVVLADLESGAEPPDNYLTIGAHWAIFSTWVGWGEQNSDKLDYIYYPIVSETHPYNKAWDTLLETYGEKEVPEEEHPALTSLAVLVKSKRYNRESKVPSTWEYEDSVTGLLIHEMDELKSGEAELLQETYPDLSLSNVMILEQDREPSSTAFSIAFILAGAVLLIGGVGGLVRHMRGG